MHERGASRAGLGILRVALAAALVLGTACSPRSTALADTPLGLDGPTVLSLRDGPLPVVRVALGGRAEAPFLVDSGASLSVIDLSRAEEMGLPIATYSRGTTVRGSGGGSVPYDGYARVEQLAVGALVLEQTRLPALESDVLEDLDLAGVLGQDLLARLVVLVDMPRRELHLLPPATDDAAIASYLGEAGVGAGAWSQAPIELRPCPFLSLEVDGRVVGELEIDTGAVGTSFPAGAIEALGLEPEGSVTMHGIDGPRESSTYALQGFDFYGFSVSCEVRSSALESGLLGMNVLGEFVFVLDGPGSRLWIHHREVPLETGE